MKAKQRVINLIESFFITFAIMNVGSFESTNILLLCFFSFALLLLEKKEDIMGSPDKRTNTISLICGLIFSILYSLYQDLSGGLENKMFILIFKIASLIGLIAIFYEITLIILLYIKKKDLVLPEKNKFPFKIFIRNALIIFICCFIFFLLNFPGVMTPDSLSQYKQATGLMSYSNHHPWCHTMIFKMWYSIGFMITKNTYISIAFYTVFQMIIVSLSVSYAIACLFEFGISKRVQTVCLLLFILTPYNLMYSITLWKDILFAMSFLVMCITISRIVLYNSWTKRDKILYFISALGTTLLRHNGLYAMIIFSLILVLKFKKQIVLILSVLILSFIVNGPVMKAYEVSKPSFAFAMTIPLQQLSRVIAYDGNISEDELAYMASINDIDYIRENYIPASEDPILAWVTYGNSDIIDNDKLEFFKVWASVGLKNPKLYIDAFVEQTKGYYTPMGAQQTMFFGITENEIGLESQPVIHGPVLIKINELIMKIHTMIPIYGILYSMGSCFFILVVLFAMLICAKKYRQLLILLPSLLIILSVVASAPLVADLRYLYSFMVTIPYLCCISIKNFKQ